MDTNCLLRVKIKVKPKIGRYVWDFESTVCLLSRWLSLWSYTFAGMIVPVSPGLTFRKTSEFGHTDQTADDSLAKDRVVSKAKVVLPAEGYSVIRW